MDNFFPCFSHSERYYLWNIEYFILGESGLIDAYLLLGPISHMQYSVLHCYWSYLE